MTGLNGLSFGGSVWSYQSLDAFQSDYRLAADEIERGADLTPLLQPKNAPIDTGLTRYLSSAGDVEAKMASLSQINDFVERFKLENEGQLPETIRPEIQPMDTLRAELFGEDGFEQSVDVLARMLERKTLTAKCAAAGKTDLQLTEEERSAVKHFCHKALMKTLQAATFHTALEGLDRGDLSHVPTLSKGSVLNAALGIAELLQGGKVTEDAVVTLVNDGSILDLTNDLDVTRMLHRSAVEAIEQFTQEKALAAALQAYLDKGGISTAQADIARAAVKDLVDSRRQFTRVLDFQIAEHDPSGKLDDAAFLKKQLQDVKIRLQQFRYDLERCTGDVGRENKHAKYGYYGIMEKLRRACSNQRGDAHVAARFASRAERTAAYATLAQIESERGNPGDLLCGLDAGFKDLLKGGLLDRARTACKTTHHANTGARFNQAVANQARAWYRYGNLVLDRLQAAGGTRNISTEVSVSVLASLGNKALADMKVSGGVFRKTTVSLTCNRDGMFTVDFSAAIGVRAGVSGGLAEGVANLDVSGAVQHSKDTTVTFKNRDELIAFCRENAPKLLQSIPGALVLSGTRGVAVNTREKLPHLYDKANLFVKAGRFLGNVLGLRIHKTSNFNEVGFEQRLHETNVFSRFDTLMAERKNGLASARTSKHTTMGDASAKVGVNFNVTDDSKDTASASAGVGGGWSGGITSKTLQTAQQAFARHTAQELSRKVLQEELSDYGQFLEAHPDQKGPLMLNALRTVALKKPPAEATPEETATFWRAVVDDLRARYDTFERDYIDTPNKIKKKDAAEFFARTTRLFAAVNELVAKRCSESAAACRGQNGAEGPAKALELTARNARNVLGARLARPRLALDFNLLQTHVQFGKTTRESGIIDLHASLEAGWDLGIGIGGSENSGGSAGDASLYDTCMENFKTTFRTALPTQFKTAGEEMLRGLSFQSGHVSGKLTGKIRVGSSEAVQPWKNADTLQLDLDVQFPLSPLELIKSTVELVERAKGKDVSGLQKVGEGMVEFSKELARDLAEKLMTVGVNEFDKGAAKIVAASPLLTLPVTGILKGVNGVLGHLGGLSIGLPTVSETQTTGCKLSLKFEDGSLASCKISDYVSNTKSLEVKLGAPVTPDASTSVSVAVGKKDTSREELVVFETLPRPNIASFLSRCNDVLGAGGPAKLQAFLLRNQGNVNRLLGELRKGAGEGVLSYRGLWATVLEDMDRLRDLAKSTDAKLPQKLKDDAADLREKLLGADGLWRRIARNPDPNETDATRIALMTSFVQTLLAGYGLLAA